MYVRKSPDNFLRKWMFPLTAHSSQTAHDKIKMMRQYSNQQMGVQVYPDHCKFELGGQGHSVSYD
jgi:hypothetical protein